MTRTRARWSGEQPVAPGPLAGLVVADFSRLLAGPYATMLLGDLGADVIKVEHPDGDDARGWGPPFLAGDPTTSAYFAAVNRNKRSVVLDLARAADREVAGRLVARADVMVHNMRADSAARFGLDAATVTRAHPELVYIDISAMGPGAAPGTVGNDFLLQAMGGAMSVTGEREGAPVKVGFPVVDVLTGLHTCVGVLAALAARDRGRGGQHVEVDLLSSLLSGLVNQSATWLEAGTVPTRMGTAHPSITPYETFPTADGAVAVAAASDRQFALLARAVARPDLADDGRFTTNASRVAHRDALVGELTAAFGAAGTAHWVQTLRAAGVPAGPVQGIDAAFALAGDAGLDPVVEQDRNGHVVRSVATPTRFGTTPTSFRRPPPALGEHTAEVRDWLAPRNR